MSDHMKKSFEFIYQIKEIVDYVGFTDNKTFSNLLSLYAEQLIYNDELYKQLEYALLNNGEYLNPKRVLH